MRSDQRGSTKRNACHRVTGGGDMGDVGEEGVGAKVREDM